MTGRTITLKQIRNTVLVLALVVPAVLFMVSMISALPMAELSLALVVFIGMIVLGIVMEFIILEVERERDYDL
ncbi:MAG: hypothetical protein AAF787_07170 [Chloroflexota bacterium]